MDWPRVRDALRHHVRRPVVRTGIYAVLWCLLWLDARVLFLLPVSVQAIGFLTALPVCLYWIRRFRHEAPHLRRAVLSACYLPLWQLAAHLPLLFSNYGLSSALSSAGTFGAFFLGLGWAVWWIDRETKRARPAASRRGEAAGGGQETRSAVDPRRRRGADRAARRESARKQGR